MKKLKCSSCGGEINVDNDKEYGTCPYCGTKYKLNEDINLNIKLDDNTKEVLSNGAKHFSMFLIVPIVLFVFIFVSIVVFGFIHSSSVDKSFEESVSQQQEDQEQSEKEWDKHMFNFTFFGDNGTKNAMFVKNTLDDIIQNNKTNDRKITLVFDGTETIDESEIISIKQSLSGEYEVSLNYDEDGYINEIVLEKLN